MNAISTPKPAGEVKPQLVERMKDSLPPLRGRYPTSPEQAKAVLSAVEQLDTRPGKDWIAQRIVTLLTHYFVADVHPAAMREVAKDWQAELEGLPGWAIEAACSWWLSRHNPSRRKKPLPGDISERAHLEARIITAGRKQVEWYEKYVDDPPAFIANLTKSEQ
ncbi:MAG: hypothetical protein CML69_15510 [Rhodobacteraceae bacterium]|nr:hypothetical protein [Paracoccaceae bacterium]